MNINYTEPYTYEICIYRVCVCCKEAHDVDLIRLCELDM